MARESGYDDFSFALQALDNSSTIGEVDPHLLKSWAKDGEIEHYRQSEAVAYLFQSIVDLQLHGERAEFNNHDNPKDKIIIHKSTTSFVAQFSIDVRDNANRPAVILCFGRMPRVAYERGGDRGLYRLQKFLKSQGIKWTESINKRY